MKIVNRLDNLPWRSLIFSSCRRHNQGLITTLKNLKGSCKDNEATWRGQRSSGELSFWLKKEIFTVWTTYHWNNVSRDVVRSPLLKVFRHSCTECLIISSRLPFPLDWTRLHWNQKSHAESSLLKFCSQKECVGTWERKKNNHNDNNQKKIIPLKSGIVF